MSPRIRKMFGGFIMLSFVIAYALLAMALADSRPVNAAPEALRIVVYVVLGLAWVLPMLPLITWMERGRLRRR